MTPPILPPGFMARERRKAAPRQWLAFTPLRGHPMIERFAIYASDSVPRVVAAEPDDPELTPSFRLLGHLRVLGLVGGSDFLVDALMAEGISRDGAEAVLFAVIRDIWNDTPPLTSHGIM